MALSLSFASCTSQQKIAETKTSTPEKYINSISLDNLKKNLYVIASDEMQGRNTGEP